MTSSPLRRVQSGVAEGPHQGLVPYQRRLRTSKLPGTADVNYLLFSHGFDPASLHFTTRLIRGAKSKLMV